jgi:hypothetical protein
MSHTIPAGAASLAAALALALPGAAQATGGDHRERGDRFRGGGDVPSRVADPLRGAARALERAEERIDDDENDRAVTALASVRKNLGAAVRAAKRRVSGDTGPDSVDAVVRAQHRVVLKTANLFDGEDGAVVDALASTLDAALDGRDDLLGAVGDADGYGFVFEGVVEDTQDETADLGEVKEDDTLTSEAEAAIDAALAQIAATGTAASARAAGGDDESADYDGTGYEGADYEGKRGECRGGRHHHGGGAGESGYPGEKPGYPTDSPEQV